ncbi:MAG: cytochrome C [Myxococcales bacterium]|nr:cytochrome C [Myxococcales bacterium]
MAEITTSPDAPAAAAAPAVAVAGERAKSKVKEVNLPNRIHTWPYLVRLEFLCALVVMIVMTVWSITIDAPLEEPANPNKTPNPSKAPWYFLGLQEMLVYFDPWMAGVILPTMIIIGLMVIPYIDVNPKGNGYYTIKERKFAVWTFLFGFLVLWILLIFLGTFMRGPGWYFFWPGQFWDPHKTVALTNVNLPYILGARTDTAQFIIGGLLTGALYGWFVPMMPLLSRGKGPKKLVDFYRSLGAVRFSITMGMFAMMMSLPIKMILRWTLNVKYVWVCGSYFNI